MTNIIVVFPKAEEGRSIRSLLVRNGFTVNAVCTTGAQAVSMADNLNGGIVLCGFKMPDMLYRELYELLPETFEMLLLASRHSLTERAGEGIVCLEMPLKIHELLDTVGMMAENRERRRRKARQQPRQRSAEEESLVREAKELLMARNHMTEEEAHKYLQKCSMDSGTNLVETARMALSVMR